MNNSKLTYHLEQFLTELKAEITEEVATSVINALGEVMALQNDRSQDDPYLTIDEVAKTFKISKSQINKLRKKHKDFPVLKIGTAVRFKQKDVEMFLQHINNIKENNNGTNTKTRRLREAI